jgi:hypothetical protein
MAQPDWARRIVLAAIGLVAAVFIAARGWAIYEQDFRLPSGRHCEVLERLDVGRASADAANDVRHGVRRLLAAGEVVVLIREKRPGVFGAPNYRVEQLPCMGDYFTSRRHETLIDRACAYVAAYNASVLAQPGMPKPNFDPAALRVGWTACPRS